MKNTINSILIILLVISAGACSTHKQTADIVTEKSKTTRILTPAQYDEIKARIKRQQECLYSGTHDCSKITGDDCRTDYCGKETCIAKIICCHKIDTQFFQLMTQDLDGYATFSKEKIYNIVNEADCKSQHIRFRIKGRRYYIRRVNEMSPSTSYSTTFYSVALLKGIYDMGIDSIRLYRGKKIDEDTKVVPFAVYYTGQDKPTYYDLSDSQP